MAETFSTNQSVKRNVTDIALNLSNTMLSSLENPEDEHEAIHTVRKTIKKMRALLRLIRKEIGEGHYKEENIDYRDIGRKLSGLRDATALIETVDKLLEIATASDYDNLQDEISDFRKKLVAERKALFEEIGDQTELREEILKELRTLKDRLHQWPLKNEAFKSWAAGLKKTYKKGKKQCEQANGSKDPHDYHEWRKRVKYLWNQLKFLEELWPSMLDAYTDSLSDLSTLLGDEHDLAVFKEKVYSADFEGQPSSEMRHFIDEQVRDLRAQAIELGQLIYAEKGKAFFSRNAAYWAVRQGEL